MNFIYGLIGIFFAVFCLGIGLFIRKKKIGKFSQAKLGLLAIIISWGCGLGILALALLT